jgi:hypothetical protein
LDLERYLPDLRASGITLVAAAFVVLVVVNLLTLPFGPDNVILDLNGNPLGPILSIIVFDTPYTLAGLIGLVMLFGPVVFGTPVAQRYRLSVFFIVASFSTGILAGIIWDRYYDFTGIIGAGSSAIAIAGQAIVFALSFFGLLRLWRQDTRKLGRMSSYWWYAFAVIYATLISTTILFVVVLQSIFVPTLEYNWRVHQFAFFLAVAATVIYEGVFWSSEGLDGKVRVDEALLNFHFDDLNDRFVRPLPKLKVVFAKLADGKYGEFRPEGGEIWMPDSFRGKEYFPIAHQVDDSLLHAMVHADLYYSGRPWQHGAPEVKQEFAAAADGVGASPEP